jgi:Na+/H+-dicarboxylate symporter
MSLVSAVFLKLIKMIIGPLVLSTLIVGIGHMGDAATVGRVGAKTMAWFVTASIVSLLLGLTLGLTMVDLLRPGVGITIADQGANTANLSTQAFSMENFIDHLVPTSLFNRWRIARSCRSWCFRYSRASRLWRWASAASRSSSWPIASRT